MNGVKELLVGLTLGAVAGAVLIKYCKPVSDMADKAKNEIAGKIEKVAKKAQE